MTVEEIQKEKSESLNVYDLFISLVAILSIALIVGLFFLDPELEMYRLLSYFDIGICVIFFMDFIRNLIQSRNKLKYLRGWGILDLAASIPAIEPFRFARLARLIRVIRAIKSIRVLLITIRGDKRVALLSMIMGTLISGLIVSCIGVLYFELQSPEANITHAGDALWWSIATITTVGYGDYYPVTVGGRICGVVLMCIGIGAFASFTGLMADLLRRLTNTS